MYVGGLEVEEVEEGGVVHGGRGPRGTSPRGTNIEDIYCLLEFVRYILFLYICQHHLQLSPARCLDWRAAYPAERGTKHILWLGTKHLIFFVFQFAARQGWEGKQWPLPC